MVRGLESHLMSTNLTLVDICWFLLNYIVFQAIRGCQQMPRLSLMHQLFNNYF